MLVALFLLGTAETFADTGAATLLPMLVAKKDLGVANARLMGGFVLANQLVGPPLGAALFAAGRTWPFLAQTLMRAGRGAARAAGAAAAATGRDEDAPARRRCAPTSARGCAGCWRHAAVRTLVLTILIFNVTFGAAWSVLVLYSLERLDLGEIGFGLLTTALARSAGCSGRSGTAGWSATSASAHIMRGGLIIETLTHLVLALTTVPCGGVRDRSSSSACTPSCGARPRRRSASAPYPCRCRAGSTPSTGSGSSAASSWARSLGGLIADRWGVTAPFWFAFVGSAIFLVLLWRQLLHIAHADEEIVAASLNPGGRATRGAAYDVGCRGRPVAAGRVGRAELPRCGRPSPR